MANSSPYELGVPTCRRRRILRLGAGHGGRRQIEAIAMANDVARWPRDQLIIYTPRRLVAPPTGRPSGSRDDLEAVTDFSAAVYAFSEPKRALEFARGLRHHRDHLAMSSTVPVINDDRSNQRRCDPAHLFGERAREG